MARSPDSGGLTSINCQDLPCNKIGRRGSEKDRGAFQILRPAKAAQGYSGQKRFLVSFDYLFGHVSREPAGCDRVHLNIVHAPFAGEIFGENDDAAFTGAVADGGKLWGRAAQSG